MRDILISERQVEREENNLFNLINFASRIRQAMAAMAENASREAEAKRKAESREARILRQNNRAIGCFWVAALLALGIYGAMRAGWIAQPLYSAMMVLDLMAAGWFGHAAWTGIRRLEAVRRRQELQK